jgi:hypothetical protein
MPMLRLGYQASSHEIIGIEYDRWSTTFNSQTTLGTIVPITLRFSWYTLVAQEHIPVRGWLRGFYAKGGLGACVFSGIYSNKNTTALAGSIGIGYDIPVVNGLAVSPYADYLVASKTEVAQTGHSVGGHLYLYGLSLMLH